MRLLGVWQVFPEVSRHAAVTFQQTISGNNQASPGTHGFTELPTTSSLYCWPTSSSCFEPTILHTTSGILGSSFDRSIPSFLSMIPTTDTSGQKAPWQEIQPYSKKKKPVDSRAERYQIVFFLMTTLAILALVRENTMVTQYSKMIMKSYDAVSTSWDITSVDIHGEDETNDPENSTLQTRNASRPQSPPAAEAPKKWGVTTLEVETEEERKFQRPRQPSDGDVDFFYNNTANCWLLSNSLEFLDCGYDGAAFKARIGCEPNQHDGVTKFLEPASEKIPHQFEVALKFRTTSLPDKKQPYLYHSMSKDTHKTLLRVHERLFGDGSQAPTDDTVRAFRHFNAAIGRATVPVEALYEAHHADAKARRHWDRCDRILDYWPRRNGTHMPVGRATNNETLAVGRVMRFAKGGRLHNAKIATSQQRERVLRDLVWMYAYLSEVGMVHDDIGNFYHFFEGGNVTSMVDFDRHKFLDEDNTKDRRFQLYQLLTLLANFCIKSNKLRREKEFEVPMSHGYFKRNPTPKNATEMRRMVSIIGECTAPRPLSKTLDPDLLQTCVAQCHERGHCCGNRLTGEADQTSHGHLSCANGCEIAYVSNNRGECKQACRNGDQGACEWKHPFIERPFDKCGHCQEGCDKDNEEDECKVGCKIAENVGGFYQLSEIRKEVRFNEHEEKLLKLWEEKKTKKTYKLLAEFPF